MADASRGSNAGGLWLAVGLAIAGLTAFYMLGAGGLVLAEPDEARCALIARHMVQSGDWLAPQLLDQPYFSKPPLYFWIVAWSIKIFGEGEWALRLPSALIMAATAGLTGLLTAQFFGRRAGWLAGATFALSVAGLMAARVVRMDMLLALWVTGALVCWARKGLTPEAGQGRSSGWYLAMYVCMGLGCLTKGPVAVVLPGLIIGIHLLLARRAAGWHRQDALEGPPSRTRDDDQTTVHSRTWIGRWWGDMAGIHIWLGALIVVAMFGSWAGYMTWRYPEYPREFFLRQNLDRFAGSGLDAVGSRFTVLGAFVGGMMPWAALVGLAGWHLRPRRGMPAGQMFLWVWGLTVLAFFSLSKGQLPNYVLPALPATFALLGAYLARADEKRGGFAAALAVTFVIAAGALVAWPIVERMRFGNGHYGLAALRLGGLAVLAGLARYLWQRGPVAALLPFLGGVAIFGVELPYGAGREYIARRSCAALAGRFKALEPTSDPVIVTTEVRYGLVYYLPDWRFHLVTEHELRELVPLRSADRPMYAVVTGKKLMDLLTGRRDMRIEIDGQELDLKDRLTVLADERGDYLVQVWPVSEGRSQRAGGGTTTAEPQLRGGRMTRGPRVRTDPG